MDRESLNSDTESDDSYLETSGPNFVDFASQLQYKKAPNYNSKNEFYYPYESTLERKEETSLLPSNDSIIPASAWDQQYTNSKFQTQRQEVTTLFMIDSKNRDVSAYPQPTSFTLRPPRIYKNVTSIQVAQLKLLTSFYYFSKAKGNTVLPIIERGRENIIQYNGFPLTGAITIADGTYDINALLNSLQTQLNYTPIFYDFPNGISDFITVFTKNGDLSVNFNQPGDTYYDSLNDKYIQNPTIAQIISYYWPSQFSGLSSYTLDQVKVAYYYPVLYELIVETSYNTDTMVYVLTLTLPPNLQALVQTTIQNYILYNASGLNDPIILYIVNQNIATLDQYRIKNTFRSYPINRYQLNYDTNSLRINIYSILLNTSLVNLFNVTSSKSYAVAFSALGLTSNSYSNSNTALNQANVVFNDMYNYIQSQLVTYFAVAYGTYASEYFIQLSNPIYIEYGQDAVGVQSNITADYLASGQVPISSYVTGYSNSPGFWPNFTRANTSNYLNTGGIEEIINVSSSMIVYSVNSSNFQYNRTVIDPTTSYINTDKSTRIVNSLITINPAQYTVFKFRSPVRQTLQVETLPLPYYYRFADYNKAGLYSNILDPSNGNMPEQYFDLSYSFVYSTTGSNQNSLMDSSNYATVILSPGFGQTFNESFVNTPVQQINTVSNYAQFEFTAPYPQDTSGLVAYATQLSFVPLIGTVWAESVEVFLYHDRGAFMADLEFPRKENSNHYIRSESVASNTSSLTLQFSTFAGDTYYTIFRSIDTNYSGNTSYIPCIYYPVSTYVEVIKDNVNFDPFASPYAQSNQTNYNFVTNYNTDFLRLPVASSIWGLDPSSSTFTTKATIQPIPIGYDRNGVSDDLTDYCGYIPGQKGFVPNTTYRIDPLSQYTFKAVTPFDTVLNTYFDSQSSNLVINTSTSQLYTFNKLSTSHITIVHWYDGYSIPQQTSDKFTTSNYISSPMTSSLLDVGIDGFPTGPNGIQFGEGITAIGFLPTDGLYEISSFTFKTVLYPASTISTPYEDPNSAIQYIGVYKGSYLGAGSYRLLSSALTVLRYTNSVVYSPLTTNPSIGFGLNYGTWYKYEYDPTFVASSNVKISGYTQGSNELLSYDSMYYMVPFDSNANPLTFSRLAGSVVPYPLIQVPSTGSTYFGQEVSQPVGVSSQTTYCMPSTISNPNPDYGPQGFFTSLTQSQYEQSQPITTTSLGYQSNGLLVRNDQALFDFTTTFSNPYTAIPSESIGETQFFTEYRSNLYLTNSSSALSSRGANYASSISTLVTTLESGNVESMYYLVNGPSTLQNYTGNILSSFTSTFTFETLPYIDTSTTIRSYEMNLSSLTTTVWLWGAGGAGAGAAAGAYAKANINVQALYETYQISTVYIVVGKAGTSASIGYGEERYGGATSGGGFSGIFTTSTLSTPLLIVGGGGAGSATPGFLGGPGGFGPMPDLLPVTTYVFSTVTLNTSSYYPIPFVSAYDIDQNSYAPGYPVASTIDGNVLTSWKPTAAYINPTNFVPSLSTYRVQLQYGSNVSTISKLRLVMGATLGSGLPTGLIVYTNSNKAQLLYSNTDSISYSNILQQPSFDLTPIPQINTTPLEVPSGYIVGGSGQTIQYSIDGSNYADVYSASPSLKSAILYVESFGKWYSCSPLQESTDGLNWVNISIAPQTTFNSLAFGNNILLACDSSGVGFRTTDGSTWTSVTVQLGISRLRFFNTSFFGITSSGLYRSTNGSVWQYLLLPNTVYDIAYGVNIYVVAQISGQPSQALNSVLVYGSNRSLGLWYSVSQTNLDGFTAKTISYARIFPIGPISDGYGGIHVAGGSTTNGSSCLKYSVDGINWFNSTYSNTGINQSINEIKFNLSTNRFIAVGQCPPGTGNAPNQRSILISGDGINWSPTISGGFNSDIGNYATCVGFGPLTILPNLSSIYMEIQSPQTPTLCEIQTLMVSSFGYETPTSVLQNMIDGDIATEFWPAEEQTVGLSNYSFSLQYSSLTTLNTLQVYIPAAAGGPGPIPYFNTITIQNTSSIQIPSNAFLLTSNQLNYVYTAVIPPISVTTVTLEITKTTTSSIQISEVVGSYDPNVSLSATYAANGYNGGLSTTMSKSNVQAPDLYNGGGGSLFRGGIGGVNSSNGRYLVGGPGGGGGYYGGGGATASGAGGGGAGYYDTTVNTIISLVDYGTALPQSNFIQSGLSEQINLLRGAPAIYGQSGNDGYIGIHSVTSVSVDPTDGGDDLVAFPSYIDGSALSLYQAQIPTGVSRNISFVSYTDPISTNYVWYNAYLSLLGYRLVPSLSSIQSVSTLYYPALPSLVYEVLTGEFNSASNFFFNSMYSVSSILSDTMSFGFEIFKNEFVKVPYTDPTYTQMTEIYCLLEYLSTPMNLVNPHVNSTSPIDRVFGGLPNFGYWANPFLTSVSYIGFDTQISQYATPGLAAIIGSSSNPVRAMYGLVLEQSLSTGIYQLKDIMAYKPTVEDASGTGWQVATQFTESYAIRPLSNILVQPYTMKNAIEGRLPLFSYSVYTTPVVVNSISIDAPVHVIQDFEGANMYVYTFQNSALDNISTMHLKTLPLMTSTVVQMNQIAITNQFNTLNPQLGTVVSQYPGGTFTQVVTVFTLDPYTFTPIVTFSTGPNNYYNTFSPNSLLSSQDVGKAILDYKGSLYGSGSNSATLYENISSIIILMEPFIKESLTYASPAAILSDYQASVTSPFYDFFQSKYTSIWHLQGTSNLSTIYVVRVENNIYDYTVITNFVNQIFYPTHKITLIKKSGSTQPIADGTDLINYPSYPRTEMFYYTNFSSMAQDVSGQFALEKASNFAATDTNSGYFLTSYINNIIMHPSPTDLNDPNSYSYLAIRAYSPSESFKSLLRFSLSNRYDFGYVTLGDLASEILTLQTTSSILVNPVYLNTLSEFTSSFVFSQKLFGATGLVGFSGSNITTTGFGDFISQYTSLYQTISTLSPIVSYVNTQVLDAQTNLILGDLRYILPSSLATRQRITDPLEFSLPFSSITTITNSGREQALLNAGQYGIGYNLGYQRVDTPFQTIQRAGSFFKILDDYIYMKLNPEYNMNRLDISRQEDFTTTRDTVAESHLYNCKLLLNTFGTYSTTFIQNPVHLNPPIGKLDKLSFSWYDSNGNPIDNSECEWSATLQIVERVNLATPDSTAARPI